MDLTSDQAYWTLRNGLPEVYPPQTQDVQCDVVILGAGISGGLIAEALTREGHSVVVLDKRDVAWGSTSATTALLQYEIDTHLVDLIERYGREMAGQAYRLCYQAIDRLAALVEELGIDCDFAKCPSVYLASRSRDVPVLVKEAVARQEAGLHCEYWGPEAVASRFPFSFPAALYTPQAARVDPCRLTHGLLQTALNRGARVFDRTEMTGVEYTGDGVQLTTQRGHKVSAKRLVVAAGYETVEAFPAVRKRVSLHSSFAMVTEPVTTGELWWQNALLWETARPYFYLRTTGDGRAMMGGEDMTFRNPAARDRQVKRRSGKLQEKFRTWFPHLAWEPAYCWAGTFGETGDGLAYIGEDPAYPHTLFALGFGGNGIIYSVIAAGVFAAMMRGDTLAGGNPFRFDR